MSYNEYDEICLTLEYINYGTAMPRFLYFLSVKQKTPNIFNLNLTSIFKYVQNIIK